MYWSCFKRVMVLDINLLLFLKERYVDSVVRLVLSRVQPERRGLPTLEGNNYTG